MKTLLLSLVYLFTFQIGHSQDITLLKLELKQQNDLIQAYKDILDSLRSERQETKETIDNLIVKRVVSDSLCISHFFNVAVLKADYEYHVSRYGAPDSIFYVQQVSKNNHRDTIDTDLLRTENVSFDRSLKLNGWALYYGDWNDSRNRMWAHRRHYFKKYDHSREYELNEVIPFRYKLRDYARIWAAGKHVQKYVRNPEITPTLCID